MSRRRTLRPEERRLWAHVTSTVTPVRGRSVSTPEFVAEGEPTKPAKPGAHRGGLRAYVVPPATVRDGGPAERSGDKRVRRGRVEVEARLDLHGMTRHQARPALAAFLAHGRERGKRCVLVITGKGDPRERRFGDDAPGVLRRALPQWLAEPDLRAMASGYAPAHVRHGGEGAWYVFLRRRG